jgi:hypothetical protein
MTPTTSRSELQKLISESENIEVTSLSLKTKINNLRRKILSGQLSEDAAVDILYNDCIDHYDLYKSDLYKISSE